MGRNHSKRSPLRSYPDGALEDSLRRIRLRAHDLAATKATAPGFSRRTRGCERDLGLYYLAGAGLGVAGAGALGVAGAAALGVAGAGIAGAAALGVAGAGVAGAAALGAAGAAGVAG